MIRPYALCAHLEPEKIFSPDVVKTLGERLSEVNKFIYFGEIPNSPKKSLALRLEGREFTIDDTAKFVELEVSDEEHSNG